jgi:hypothetical protein
MSNRRNDKRIALKIKNTSHKKLLLVLPLLAMSVFAGAQSFDSSRAPKWAFYQVNPIGLISKERIKVERRLNPTNSVALAYTKFYGISTDNQVFGEYRHYHRGGGKTEFFVYGKAGFGAGTTSGFETGNSYGPYQYMLAGGGAGWHISIGRKEHFFFDLALGLKYAGVYQAANDNNEPSDPETTFRLFGSGSYLDISSCFGWQFK